MDRFSEDLRHERERCNISLDTMCVITKVPSRYLRALEDGHLADLPSGVFRKGILRSYLAALELDPAPWVERFDRALTPAGAASAPLAECAEPISRHRPPQYRERDVRWFGVAGMFFAVGLLGWCLWHFVLHGHVVLSSLLGS